MYDMYFTNPPQGKKFARLKNIIMNTSMNEWREHKVCLGNTTIYIKIHIFTKHWYL